jgi:hypothetical protein
MSQLLFKRRFIPAILRGEKTTTLRRWKSARVRPGSTARVSGVGWVKIISCKQVRLRDLTLADAKADGFGSLEELFQTVWKIYPDHASDGRHWYRVGFQLQNEPEDTPAQKVIGRRAPAAARKRLAGRIRVLLDKAVRKSGSLSAL